MRGAYIGFGGDAQADKTSKSTAQGTDHKGKGHQWMGCFRARGKGQEDGNGKHKDRQDLVLCLDERHGTVGNIASDALHLISTFWLLLDPQHAGVREEYGNDARSRE